MDITRLLEYRALRKRLPIILLNVDELMGRAVQDVVGREEFKAAVRPGKKVEFALVKKVFPTAFAVLRNILYRENYQAIDEMNYFLNDTVCGERGK